MTDTDKALRAQIKALYLFQIKAFRAAAHIAIICFMIANVMGAQLIFIL